MPKGLAMAITSIVTMAHRLLVNMKYDGSSYFCTYQLGYYLWTVVVVTVSAAGGVDSS